MRKILQRSKNIRKRSRAFQPTSTFATKYTSRMFCGQEKEEEEKG
jgi:hypothetical protein